MTRPAWLDELIAGERLPESYHKEVAQWQRPLAGRIAGWAGETPGLVVGVCAPQASGKSTLCAVLERLLAERGLTAVTLALDDLYLGRAERARLAAEVHPLLATRGAPGTHDVELGLRLLEALAATGDVTLPRFDKAADDRDPRGELRVQGPVDVILFEGWCVAARPQGDVAVAEPVNRLEAEEDAEGAWRRWVNGQLASPYAELFGRIDRLVLLRPPGSRWWRGGARSRNGSCGSGWRKKDCRRAGPWTMLRLSGSSPTMSG